MLSTYVALSCKPARETTGRFSAYLGGSGLCRVFLGGLFLLGAHVAVSSAPGFAPLAAAITFSHSFTSFS
jgi:hypothetical protein